MTERKSGVAHQHSVSRVFEALGLQRTQDMVVSRNKGPQHRPQHTIVLIIGTPKMVPLILGNPHIRLIEFRLLRV